ncbi:MAG: putative regulatory protein, FmdB family [Dehalococcoidia bacterium]|nr:putative regulatory protein, FmdB family [Dehalococcoidia bacterium]
MPTYEYECGSCHHRFDLKQGFDAEPVEPCPLCHEQSRRRFHAPTIISKSDRVFYSDFLGKEDIPPDARERNEEHR